MDGDHGAGINSPPFLPVPLMRGCAMWMTVCRDCGWTSGECQMDSAFACGQLHAEDFPGHIVVIKQIAVGLPQTPIRTVAFPVLPK